MTSVGSQLLPGKGFKYVRGEIKEFFITHDAIFGTLSLKESDYAFMLNKEELSGKIQLGLDLVILNGYCQKNKKGIVITDGKFGKAFLEINMDRYYSNTLITGKVLDFKRINNKLSLSLVTYKTPFLETYSFSVKSEDINILPLLNKSKNRIVRIQTDNGHNQLVSIEILPNEHFLYNIDALFNGCLEKSILFDFVLLKHIKMIDKAYAALENLLFQTKAKISKSDLKDLKDLLFEKVYKSSYVPFPYIILLRSEKIWDYLNKLIHTTKYFLDNPNFSENIDILLKYLRYFFPPIST